MLFGEHAVLHGQPAVVCAINRRVTVTLCPIDHPVVRLRSALGEVSLDITNPVAAPPFHFAAGCVAAMPALPGGCELTIEADFPPDLGLGSSAAVCVAILGVLSRWLELNWEPTDVMRCGVAVIRHVQGIGSGADVAASTRGGVLRYDATKIEAVALNGCPRLSVVYSGAKKPTVEVIRHVESIRRRRPEAVATVFASMGEVAQRAAQALNANDWEMLGRMADLGQSLMESLELSNTELDAIVQVLRKDSGIRGCKISGSGLGDCVVGFGERESDVLPYRVVDAQITREGLRYES